MNKITPIEIKGKVLDNTTAMLAYALEEVISRLNEIIEEVEKLKKIE